MTIGQAFICLGFLSVGIGICRECLTRAEEEKKRAPVTVAWENAQIITRIPGVKYQTGPMVIRTIKMKDGTLITQNWRPVIGSDGKPDLEKFWESVDRPQE